MSVVERKHMQLRFWLGYAVVAAIAIGSIATALLVRDRETDNFAQIQDAEAARSARQAEAVARLSVGQLASAAAAGCSSSATPASPGSDCRS